MCIRDRFIHTHGSLENHTQFQTKMGEVYTRFRTKKAPKIIPFGSAHTYMAYIRESAPLPGTDKVGVMGSAYLPKKPNQVLHAF